MAAPKVHSSEKRKRPGTKKSQRRTVDHVSSSESDSDVSEPKSNKMGLSEDDASTASPEPAKKSKKVKASKAAPVQENDRDVQMRDGDARPTPAVSKMKPTSPTKEVEDFGSIYLRKVTAELADDLDKVREAKDFKSSSLPMLIHALKQGGSMYSTEERRRVVGAGNS